MRESIHKYFQVGTIRWMSFPNRSVVDQVKRIAVDDYFDAIEVTKCADDAEREEVKKILEDAGIGFIKLGKPTDERHILVSKDGVTYQFGII